MKYFKKSSISSSLFILALCLTFTGAEAQQDNGNRRINSKMQHMRNPANQQMVKGQVVDAQHNVVANATIKVTSKGAMMQKNSESTKQSTSYDTTDRLNNSSNMHSDMQRMSVDTTVETNQNGEFTLQNISAGMYSFKVKKDGYQNWQNAIRINSMRERGEMEEGAMEEGEMNEHDNNRNEGSDQDHWNNKDDDNENTQDVRTNDHRNYGNSSRSNNEGPKPYTKSLYLTIKIQQNNR